MKIFANMDLNVCFELFGRCPRFINKNIVCHVSTE